MPKTAKPSAEKIKTAMQAPEKRVCTSNQGTDVSFASAVRYLEIGEHRSKSVEIDGNTPLYELAARINDTKESLRNNTAASVRLAKKKTGDTYSIEIGDMRTPSGRTFVVAIVTRTA